MPKVAAGAVPVQFYLIFIQLVFPPSWRNQFFILFYFLVLD